MAYESIVALGLFGAGIVGILSVVRTITLFATNKKLKRIEETLENSNKLLNTIAMATSQEEMPVPEMKPKINKELEKKKKETEAKRTALLNQLAELEKQNA